MVYILLVGTLEYTCICTDYVCMYASNLCNKAQETFIWVVFDEKADLLCEVM